MHTDPIADMLTRVRNAQMVGAAAVLIPRSNMKFHLAELLRAEGYLAEVREIEENERQSLKLKLKYHNDQPVIKSITRVSKPGQRVYVKSKSVPRVLGGLGVVIVSTPKGLMTGREARKQKLGGEIICEVY